MKRLGRGLRWTTHWNPTDLRVHLHIGEDTFSLRPHEAVLLANSLIDTTEEAGG